MSTKGYLPHSVVKGVVFWVLSACIMASTASGILRFWGTMGEEVAANCLWTAFTLALGSIAFLILNCVFGDLGNALVGRSTPPPVLDPAFSEALKRSKVGADRPAGTDEAGS